MTTERILELAFCEAKRRAANEQAVIDSMPESPLKAMATKNLDKMITERDELREMYHYTTGKWIC